MPNLTRGLFDLSTRAGRLGATRRLTGTSSLLGRVGAAARSYAGTVAGLWRGPKQDALKTVKGIARRVAPPQYGAAPPVVPGLAEQLAGRSAYSPATQELQRLTADILRRTSIGERDAEDLAGRVLNLLRSAKADPAVGLDQRRGLEDILVWLEHRFQRPPAPPTTAQAASGGEDEQDWGGRANIGAWTDEQVQDAMSQERRTPGSSNVYSYFWVPDEGLRKRQGMSSAKNGTLFVTFLAWHPGMSKKRGGQGGKSETAGPTYAYSNVPATKLAEFEKFAERSAGGAVWEYLRVRGSKYGHQHPYRIVAGVQVPGGGEYVPRKVTSRGLARRAILNPRTGTFWSTLPAEQNQRGEGFLPAEANYSYAQWREIARQRNVDRGRADRGAPDRGRP